MYEHHRAQVIMHFSTFQYTTMVIKCTECTDGVIMYEHHRARVIMHGPTTWASLASEGVVRLGLREIPPLVSWSGFSSLVSWAGFSSLVSWSGFSSWPLGIQNDSQYYKVYVVNWGDLNARYMVIFLLSTDRIRYYIVITWRFSVNNFISIHFSDHNHKSRSTPWLND